MRDLKIEFKENLGFVPPIVAYLATITELSYSYNYYGLRHPAGIFNIQFSNVVVDFLDLLQHIKELGDKEVKDIDNKLAKKYTTLLFSFANYFESSYEIILGCCKQHTIPQENDFLYNWLKKNKYTAGRQFYEATKDDIQFFKDVFNKLKHTSNIIRGLFFYKDKDKIFGYYLESADRTGSIGPSEIFHPKFHNMYTGNSFNLDLRRLYYCIYKVADSLKSALVFHFREVYSVDISCDERRKEDDSHLKKLYDEITHLPNLFFPNECGKLLPYPEIQIEDGKRNLVFKIKNVQPQLLSGYQVRFTTSGDGFSRSFHLPYFY